MKLRSACWPLLCVAVLTLGCAKGDTGPMGPRGSANVIYSDWYSPSPWNLETEFSITQRFFKMGSTSLTQEVIDHGVVMVYMRFVGLNPEIVPLPVLIPDVMYQFYFRAKADSIKVVYYSHVSPTTTPIVIPSDNLVRYVLIPGGTMASAMQADGLTREQEIASLRSMSYSQVCRKYGIPE